ncbi:hypothetical protein ABZ690_24570 [Streptomyces sp. NPDC006967]|uniref:hypothetical protein n=1 Tax=unclassified Streptomyces TaxID=2593676 RepID=UPI00215608DD|nr:hypothetical protein [Streptomyces sp. SM1]
MFALDAGDRSLLRRVQLAPASDSWSPWERFGGPAGAVPTLGRNTDGRLEVFSLAPGGAQLHHRAQRPDGGWHDWEVFGGPAGAAPAVGVGAGGRLEAFVLAPGGTGIARRRQSAPGSTAWEGCRSRHHAPTWPVRSKAPSRPDTFSGIGGGGPPVVPGRAVDSRTAVAPG